MPCCEVPPGALSTLRGLHLPPDPGLVRPGVLAAVVAGLALAGLVAWLWPRWRARPVRRAALAELAAARDPERAAIDAHRASEPARRQRTAAVASENQYAGTLFDESSAAAARQSAGQGQRP